MRKTYPEQNERQRDKSRPSLSMRLETVRYLSDVTSSGAHRRHSTNIQHIAEALVAAGYISLDAQAKALGIHRATAWTIIRNRHKLDRLNTKTTKRMLANPELPQCIRDVLQRYVAERALLNKRSKRMARPADTSDGKQ